MPLCADPMELLLHAHAGVPGGGGGGLVEPAAEPLVLPRSGVYPKWLDAQHFKESAGVHRTKKQGSFVWKNWMV